MAEKYLVWSNEHRAWWRSNSAGYTLGLSSAGRYDRDEAIKICAHARNGWDEGEPPSEIPVREQDALDAVGLFAAAMQRFWLTGLKERRKCT